MEPRKPKIWLSCSTQVQMEPQFLYSPSTSDEDLGFFFLFWRGSAISSGI